MTSDFVYKMQPSGHEEQPIKRKYSEPSSELKLAFEQWCGKWYELLDGPQLYLSRHAYCDALKIAERLKPSISEGHGLLMSHIDENTRFAGPFISAIYNSVPDKHIHFDLDLDKGISYLGVNLAKDKVLVNTGNIGDYALYWSDATLINQGSINYFYGMGKGQIINYGKTNDSFSRTCNLLIVNLGDEHICIDEPGFFTTVINFKPMDESRYVFFHKLLEGRGLRKAQYFSIPEFGNYMTDLEEKLELGRKDYTKALETLAEFGPRPGEKIFEDIRNILKRAGKNV